MQIWDFELRQQGFTHCSSRYWKCSKGFGLENGEHVSLFLRPEKPRSRKPRLFEVCEFHVTIPSSIHHLHFYYHEKSENCWECGGHTSGLEISMLGQCPEELKQDAQAIAVKLIEAWRGTMADQTQHDPSEFN